MDKVNIGYLNAVLEDPRPDDEKKYDFKHENLFMGTPVQWVETPQSQWKRYNQRNQNRSYSCVMQSSAKALETMNVKVNSAIVYKLRSNYPSEGMYLKNAGDILYHTGTTTEDKAPSQNMNESQMNSATIPKTDIKVSGYRTFINHRNIDSIAEAIDAHGHCVLTFVSNGDEWDEPNCTPVYKGQPTTFGHAICAVDYTLINGVKCLICEDSSGQWSSPDGLRIITEDFLKQRATGAIYYLGVTEEIHETIVTPNATIDTIKPATWWATFKDLLTKMGIKFKETIGAVWTKK